MDKPTVDKMATVVKSMPTLTNTREQFDEAIKLLSYLNQSKSTDDDCRIIIRQEAIIDRMTKHIAHTCICCPILGIGTCPRDAEQCPETVRRYFAEGK